MTDIVDALEADFAAFEQTASLVYELYMRLLTLRDGKSQKEITLRAGLAAAVWAQLDELGVDLRIDDLKTAVIARVATAPTSGGATPTYASAGAESSVDTPAASPVVPPEPTDEAEEDA